MPSHNESIIRHPKAALLGCIIELNLGSIIAQKIAMRAKQNQTSFPFHVLFKSLCRRSGVPFVAKTDIEVTYSSSCDICRIEAEYLKDEIKKKKKARVDTSLVVDVVSIEARPTHPTPAVEPYNIPTSSIVPAPTHAFRPRLTQGMIYKIGNLAHSADVRDSRVEVDVPSMIDHAIAAALALIQEELREQ